MASRDDIRNQQEYNRLLKEEQALLRENRDFSREVNDDLRAQIGYSTQKSTVDREIASLSSKISKQLSNQVIEQKSSIEAQKSMAANTQLYLKAESEAISIVGQSRQKEILKAIAAQKEANRLEELMDKATGARAEELFRQAQEQEAIADEVFKSMSAEDEKAANLLIQGDRLRINNELLQKQKERLDTITDAGGTFSGLLTDVGKSLDKLGLGDLSKAMKLDEVNEQMLEFKSEITEGGTKAAGLGGHFRVVGKQINLLGGSLMKALPIMLFAGMAKHFNEIADAQKEVRQTSGQAATNFHNMNDSLAGTLEQTKAIGALSKELGINVNAAFSPETILAAARLTELMGISADSAANMALRAEASGQNLNAQVDSTDDIVNNFNRNNRSAVNLGQVMDDVGKVSNATALSMGLSHENLVEAAATARKFGLELQALEKTADSLLSIESSLEAELKAELLTGKQLNLEKARAAALTNDLAAMTKAIADNEEIINAFSTGTRIEQQAIADALGMSREEVAGMALAKMRDKGMTDAQIEAATGLSVAELERAKVQEQLKGSLNKILGIFYQILAPVAQLMSNSVVLGITLGLIAFSTLPKILGGIKSFYNGLKDSAKLVREIGTSIMNMINRKKGAKAAESISDVAGDAVKGATEEVKEAAEGTSTVTQASGENTRTFLTNLSEGLKAMADGKVFVGIGAMALAGPALLLSVPAIPFLLFMGTKPLPLLKPNFTGLAAGLTRMATAIAGVGVMSLLGPALLLSVAAIPFLAFMAIPGIGVLLRASFKGLAGGLKAMSNPQLLMGIGMLALLGIALIPLGYALSLVAPLVEAFGNVIVGVMSAVPPIIQSIAEGFVTMMSALSIEKVAALALLGPALLVASVGLGAFGIALAVASAASFLGGGIINKIARLAEAAPGIKLASENLRGLGTEITSLAENLSKITGFANPLFLIAAGITAISASLMFLGAAGVFALPGVFALTSLAAVATPLIKLAEVFGISKKEEEPAEDVDQELLKELIAETKQMKAIMTQILAKDVNVYMDSEKVDASIKVGSKLGNT